MKGNKLAALVTTALASAVGVSDQALAQSTGSQAQEEEIVITSSKPKSVEGAVIAQRVAKSRTAIGQEYVATQSSGQSVAQTLNVVTPGYNFTNNDPYGSSGGNLRLRGFDGNRVSLTWDGVPLNDSGNYAIFTNQLLDPEVVDQVSVNTGTTDVNSPTASAVGGTVNVITRKPTTTPGLATSFAYGDFRYGRAFGMVDTGELWGGGPSAFFSFSKQDYQKFKGLGALDKKQYNGRIYQPLRGKDFVSLAVHYNENRNNNYRTLTLLDFTTNGGKFDFDPTCNRPIPVNGTAQIEATSGTPSATVFNCTNYYGRQVNPSNTGNLRGQSSFHLGENLRFTFDPSFQYVLADGGGQYGVLSETDKRIIGQGPGTGKDLNGDLDTQDTVGFLTPSVTNTRRYGATSSLIWDINDDQRVRLAVTYDEAHHRQTGEYTYLDQRGNPADPFGGKDSHGPKVLALDGATLEARNRTSIAKLEQAALEYRGQFLDDRLTVNIGLRAPYFTRELNQFCYSQNGSTTVRCTTETPASTIATGPYAGNVTFTGVTANCTAPGTTVAQACGFVQPYSAVKKYDAILPNVGAVFKLGENSSIYASYAEGFSAPRTDNLYTITRLNGVVTIPGVEPETTKAYDLGYRYSTSRLQSSLALWRVDYTNRIVSSFDDTLGVTIDRNVGDARSWGVDGQIGAHVFDHLTLIGAASYNHSELLSNFNTGTTTTISTKGKQFVETPKVTLGWRGQWDSGPVHLGLQGKYVSDRFSTDVNDQKAPHYTVWDADATFDLPGFGVMKSNQLQLNVINLGDAVYFGSISSRNNAAGNPTYNIAAPLTAQIALKSKF